MVVRFDGEARKSIADIQNLYVSSAKGQQIPLSYVASIEEIEGVNQIQRENTKRRIIVGFNITERDVQTIVKELQAKINEKLQLQKGYTIVYGGSFENMTAAKNRLSIVVPIALLLIFLLLYFAFGSVKQGLLIYTAIPLSAMGGIIALWARDMPFSISAGVGFIALFGVAVLNGILLVSEFNRLKAEGWHDSIRIVIHATKSKLRAVLMTALVPALGFIPMAISTGAGGEVQKPLATVVIGGLIISTMLTLFVLPVMYLLFEKGTQYIKMNKNSSFLVLVLILISSASNAQNNISLNAAIDSSLKNNASLKVASMEVNYYQALKKSHLDFEKTLFDFGYGKINGFQNDNRITVTQNIQFPAVYKSLGAINKTNFAISELSKLQKEIELKAAVKSHFYNLLLLQRRRQLLLNADSIYTSFASKAKQRFEAGNTDILEKITAESQLAQISNQLQLLNTGYEVLLNQFNILINTKTVQIPFAENNIIELQRIPDLLSVPETPQMKLSQEKISLAENQLKLEKGKLQPSFNLGYVSSTIMGWQPITQNEEKYFGQGYRFNAFNMGLSIPLFSTAQRSRIAAGGISVQKNKLEQLAGQQQLTSNLSNLVTQYLQNKKLITQYQQSILPNTNILIETASKKLTAGEIGYLEWVMIINQAIQIQSEYFNYVLQLNEGAIEIEKISSNN
jgi:cobalt-zinc-cadmium resistance protein CzcA